MHTVVLFLSAMYIGVNLLVDVLYAYIDPRVFERYYAGQMIAVDLETLAERDGWPEEGLRDAEAAVVRLLRND